MTVQHPELLEPSPHEGDEGNLIGRDPRNIEADAWLATDLSLDVGLTAIRRKCLDCCADSVAEVRKCVCTTCPLWPLRMGSNPAGFKKAREIQDAQRERQPISPALQKAHMARQAKRDQVQAERKGAADETG